MKEVELLDQVVTGVDVFKKRHVFTVFLLALLTLASACEAKDESPWTRLRLLVHVNTIEVRINACDIQHLNEHIWSRKIHKSLDERISSPFRVDAVSTLDKVVMSVDIFNSRFDDDQIAGLIKEALHQGRDAQLTRQEAKLLIYEERIRQQNLGKANLLLRKLSAVLGPSSTDDCTVEELLNSATELKPSNYNIEVLRVGGSHSEEKTVYRSQTKFVAKSNWKVGRFESFVPASSASKSGNSALFFAMRQVDLEGHVVALSAIYDVLRRNEQINVTIRPLGLGGLVVEGDAEDLETLLIEVQENKARNQGKSTAESIAKAQRFFCRRNNALLVGAGLPKEAVSHLYFSFWQKDSGCGSQPKQSAFTRHPFAFVTLLALSEEKASENTIGDIILPSPAKMQLCIDNADQFPQPGRELISISAYAVRQHVRYDLGLALNVHFGKIDGNCVPLLLFVPTENRPQLSEFAGSFDGLDQRFVRRIRMGAAAYYCRIEKSDRCSYKDEGFDIRQFTSDSETPWLTLREYK